MATAIVASKAERSDTDSGFQTQGGMPRLASHECGTSPVTPARYSPVLPAEGAGRTVRSTARLPVTSPSS